jgi:hypothetical protein
LPTYQQLYSSFRWNIPARYNIAADVCDRHAADASKIALIGSRRQDRVSPKWLHHDKIKLRHGGKSAPLPFFPSMLTFANAIGTSVEGR